jgi:D-inositol-3-phosphate glycosyltransferase
MDRRLLHVSLRMDPLRPQDRPTGSGQAVLVQDTVRALQAQGYGIDVLTAQTTKNDPRRSVLGHMGRIIRLPTRFDGQDEARWPGEFESLTAQALQWIREEGPRRYRLVHSYYWISAGIAGPVARTLRLPWIHTPLVLPAVAAADTWPVALVARQLKEADRVLVTNSDMADRVIALEPEARVRVVPPAVDPTVFFPRDPGPILRRLHLNRRGILLVVSQQNREAVRQFLTVWRGAAAAGQIPDECRLIVVGAVDMGDTFEDVAGPHVVLARAVPHRRLPLYYAAATCTVVPGHRYTLGLTALESLASGVPVVATRVPALEQVMWSDETGVLVAPDDMTGMVEQAVAFWSDSGAAAQRGRRGQEVVRDCFTIERMARELIRIYDEVDAGGSQAAGLGV